MQYVCPYCQNSIKSGIYCYRCLIRVDKIRKIWEKSSAYYNHGLKAAQRRELSLAKAYLQKATMLYKYNIDARNLLGLVYLEVGQTAEALKEWIISKSLKNEDNIASYYIEQIRKDQQCLVTYKESSILYNQALGYLHQGDRDMAMIRLKKAVSVHPQFVQAKVLLSLIYIEEKQYYKANEQIKKVLVIDKSHRVALSYFNKLSQKDTQSKEPYEIDYTHDAKLQPSFNKIMDTKSSHIKSIVYFLTGALATGIVGVCLVLPNKIEGYQNQIIQLQDSKESLSTQVQILAEEYKVKVADLENQNKSLQTKVTSYKEEVTGYKQKEGLEIAKNLVDEGEYKEAAKTLYTMVTTHLEPQEQEQIDELKEIAYARAIDSLYNEGINFYNNEEYAQATDAFETLLQYEPGEWTARKSLYHLADLYDMTGNIEEAKKYYNKLIADYPDTRESYRAQEWIDKLNAENR